VPGRAIRIKAGSDIVLEMHYTTSGKAASDLTTVGLVFAKEPPSEAITVLPAINTKFAIPPGDPNYEVKSSWKVPSDMKLVNLLPHMHLRGKDFEFVAKYPTGEKEVLLRVPHYDFNWQHFYVLAEPKVLPAGTVIECTAHYDNSANNKFNPDPTKEIHWGDQSWDEMMAGFMTLVYDARKPESEVFPPPKKTEKPAASAGTAE